MSRQHSKLAVESRHYRRTDARGVITSGPWRDSCSRDFKSVSLFVVVMILDQIIHHLDIFKNNRNKITIEIKMGKMIPTSYLPCPTSLREIQPTLYDLYFTLTLTLIYHLRYDHTTIGQEQWMLQRRAFSTWLKEARSRALVYTLGLSRKSSNRVFSHSPCSCVPSPYVPLEDRIFCCERHTTVIIE